MKKSLKLIHRVFILILFSLLIRSLFLSELRIPLISNGFIHKIEGLATDLKFKLRPAQKISSDLVLVEVDNNTLIEFPEYGRWPWKRDPQAFLLYSILKFEPKAVLVDIIYSEKEQVQIPLELTEELKRLGHPNLAEKYAGDSKLLKIINKYNSKIVLTGGAGGLCGTGMRLLPCDIKPETLESSGVEKFLGSTAPENIPDIQQPILNLTEYNQVASHFGISSSVPDLDGVLRTTYLSFALNGKIINSNAHALANIIRPGNFQAPLSPLQVNFKQAQEGSIVSAADIFWSEKEDASGQKIKEALTQKIKDRIVVLGVTATSAGDYHSTPLGNLSGPEILLSIADNALNDDFIKTPPPALSLVLLIGFIFLAYFTTRYSRTLSSSRVLILFVSTLFLFVCIDIYAFSHNLNLPSSWFYLILIFEFGFLIYENYSREESQRSFIKSAFSRYVSPDYVNELIQNPEKLKPGGEKKELTVLFSDVRGFTNFSEKMDAQLLGRFLNEYFDDMTSIIFNSRGTLDKFIGDAVMAFWGDPLPEHQHAELACDAAVQMIRKIKERRPYYKEKYGVDLDVGIGINTGVVTVGNLGSSLSLGYTVIGDEVNLTSRLEGATKFYGVEILTTEQSLQSIEKTGGQIPRSRKIDFLVVKGKSKPIEITQIFAEDINESLVEKFNLARNHYLKRDFVKAKELFSEIKEDSVSKLYVDRCEKYISQPPPQDWDGSWKLDSK